MRGSRIGAALTLAATAATLAAGCGSGSGGGTSTTSAGQGNKAFVVLVTDINQLNDHGFNQLAYEGLKRAEKDLGVRGDVFQSPSSADYVPNLATAAE